MQQSHNEEQTFFDATMNARLADACLAGALWAATDYYGRPMTVDICTFYHDKLTEVQTLAAYSDHSTINVCPWSTLV